MIPSISIPYYLSFRDQSKSGTLELQDVTAKIAQPDDDVAHIRSLEYKSSAYQDAKERRWCVKFGCDGEHKTIEDYGFPTGLVYIDIDHSELPIAAFHKLPNWLVAVWRSVSGKGYGLLAYADTIAGMDNGPTPPDELDKAMHFMAESYADHYHAIGAQISAYTGAEADPACSNINRINFVSSDPDMYARPLNEVEPFSMDTDMPEPKPAPKAPNPTSEDRALFRKANNDTALREELAAALLSNGWSNNGRSIYWTRPGKNKGASAMWNEHGQYAGKFKVFTSESHDLQQGMYDNFALYQHLICDGDISKAYAQLSDRYGMNSKQQPTQAAPKVKQSKHDTDEIAELAESIPLPTVHEIRQIRRDKLSENFNNACDLATNDVGAPWEFAMLSLITVLGAATQGNLVVSMKETHQEKVSAFGLILSRPGIKKTPVVRAMIRPIVEYERQLRETYEAQMAQYEKELEDFEAMSKTDKELQKESKPQEPKRKGVMLTAYTMELLMRRMMENNESQFVFPDEFMRFIGGMNMYRKGGGNTDLYDYLSMWSGTTINRETKTSSEFLAHPHISLVSSGTTHTVLPYLRETSLENGFFERILFAIPINEEAQEGGEVNLEDVQWYTNRITDMLHYFSTLESPLKLTPCPEVKERMKTAAKQLATNYPAELVKKGEEGKAQLPAKLYTYLIRMLGVAWAARNFLDHEGTPSSTEVTMQDYKMASALMDYFHDTLFHVYDKMHNSGDPAALSGRDLSEYRRDIAERARALYPKLSARMISEIVNYLTKGHKEVSQRTVSEWLRKAR